MRGYNRIAPVYDLMLSLAEHAGLHKWRKLLWSKAEGRHILELGFGTGASIPDYPHGARIVAMDFSEKMLARGKEKAMKAETKAGLLLMDVEHLGFKNNAFDCVVASLLFCSVPDPVRGLEEAKGALKPGGKLALLEHVISDNAFLARLMDWTNPLALRTIGDNINRRTVDNVARAGFSLEKVTRLGHLFRLIEARKPTF